MNLRLIFGAVVGAIAAGVVAVRFSGCVHYPSCGEYHYRATDGASCAECVDRDGSRFGRCGMKVMENRR